MRQSLPRTFLCAILLFGFVARFAAANPKFYDLGTLHGPSGESEAAGVSADGTTVVGRSSSAATGPYEAFRWSIVGGIEVLGPLPAGPDPSTQAQAASGNGRFVAGESIPSSRDLFGNPVLWDRGVISQLATLGDGPWGITDISANGNVIVAMDWGNDSLLAAHWIGGVPSHLPNLPGANMAIANGVSADGSIVVGQSAVSGTAKYRPVRWENGIAFELTLLANTDWGSAEAVSGNGVVAVGTNWVPGVVAIPVRWVGTAAPIALEAPPEFTGGRAHGASHDGSVIVGAGDFRSIYTAFIWDQANGIRTLNEYLTTSGFGLTQQLSGWKLGAIQGISADGKVIVGNGITPAGRKHGWMVDLHYRPVNDFCADAQVINPGNTYNGYGLVTTTGTTQDARPDGSSPCSTSGSPDVWYTVTPPVDGRLSLDLCGSSIEQPVISIHAGCPGGSANQIFCANNCPASTCAQPCVDQRWVPMTAGQTYYIRVASKPETEGGLFTLHTQFFPNNDDCSDAYFIDVPSQHPGQTFNTSLDPAPICEAETVTAPGVWYKVVGTGSTMTASTCSVSDFDTKLSVYCGGCGVLACVAANDDAADNCGLGTGTFASKVSWCAVPGQTYHVLVHGFETDAGSFALNVSADSASCGFAVNCSPTNDDCANATPVYQGTILADNTAATISPVTASCQDSVSDLWYSYRTRCEGEITIDTCQLAQGSLDDTVLSVRDACDGSDLACNDDYADPTVDCGRRSAVTFPVDASRNLSIRVAGYSSGTQVGTFPLRVTEVPDPIALTGGALPDAFVNQHYQIALPISGACPPYFFESTGLPNEFTIDWSGVLSGTPMVSGFHLIDSLVCDSSFLNPDCTSAEYALRILPDNDQCAGATAISEGGFAFGNVGATTDGPDEPGVCDFSSYTHIESDIWYRYTSSCNGIATASLCGSSLDTKIAVYPGVCPIGPAAVACNDDACDLQSMISFGVSLGVPYLLRIGGYAASQGAGQMTITCFNDCNANTRDDLADIAAGESDDCNANLQPDECDRLGDATGDDAITLADFLFLRSCATNPCPEDGCVVPLYGDPCCRIADLNSDGDVDLNDLAILLNSAGTSSP